MFVAAAAAAAASAGFMRIVAAAAGRCAQASQRSGDYLMSGRDADRCSCAPLPVQQHSAAGNNAFKAFSERTVIMYVFLVDLSMGCM